MQKQPLQNRVCYAYFTRTFSHAFTQCRTTRCTFVPCSMVRNQQVNRKMQTNPSDDRGTVTAVFPNHPVHHKHGSQTPILNLHTRHRPQHSHRVYTSQRHVDSFCKWDPAPAHFSRLHTAPTSSCPTLSPTPAAPTTATAPAPGLGPPPASAPTAATATPAATAAAAPPTQRAPSAATGATTPAPTLPIVMARVAREMAAATASAAAASAAVGAPAFPAAAPASAWLEG